MTAPFAGVARGKVAWSTPSTGGGDGAPVHGDAVSSMADTDMADGNNTDTAMTDTNMADASRGGGRSSIEDIETVPLHLHELHGAPEIFMSDTTETMPPALGPAVEMAATWSSSTAPHGGAGVADHEPPLLPGSDPLYPFGEVMAAEADGGSSRAVMTRDREIAVERTPEELAELTAFFDAKSSPSPADREHDPGEGEEVCFGDLVHVDPDDGEATR